MSVENVEIVRGAFEAFERGDVGQMVELMADDLVTHRIDPDDAVYHGKEGWFQAALDWTEDFEEWTATAEEFVDAGDDVLVRARQTARGEASGVRRERFLVPIHDARWEGRPHDLPHQARRGVRGGGRARLALAGTS